MNTLRIKRRWTGVAGAPASLKSGELAYNGLDDTLYIGFGDDGSGNATSIKVVAGFGASVMLSTDQTVGGIKTFSSSPLVPTVAAGDNSTKAASTAYVDAAASLKIDASQKGAANGVASLDGTGKVPSTQLPSFVDDVLEYANLAAFPATGATGVLYVALDTNKVYRWSGTVYVEISGSPGSTDAVPEGSINLYYTTARARGDVIVQTVTNGDTTHAPSSDVVFDQLALTMKKVSNLSDLANAGTARTNLGLGSMAIQSAAGVAITGGSIDGVTLDGGTY